VKNANCVLARMLKTFPSAVMSAVLRSTIFSVNEGQVNTDEQLDNGEVSGEVNGMATD